MKTAMRGWSLWLGILFFCTPIFSGADSGSPSGNASVGVITYLKGTVELTRQGNIASIALDTPIFAEDIISTKEQSKVRIIFSGPLAQGMTVIPPETTFQVQSVLATTTADRHLTAVTNGFLQSLSQTTSQEEVAMATRPGILVSWNKFVVFPSDRVLNEVKTIRWLPVPNAKTYTISLESDDPKWSGAHEKTTTGTVLLEKDLPKFIPGVLYTLKIQAHNGDRLVAEEKMDPFTPGKTFMIKPPTANDAAWLNEIADLANSSFDQDDPTPFLIRSQLYLDHGYHGNAFLELYRCSKILKSPASLIPRLKKILASMHFNPREVNSVPLETLFAN